MKKCIVFFLIITINCALVSSYFFESPPPIFYSGGTGIYIINNTIYTSTTNTSGSLNITTGVGLVLEGNNIFATAVNGSSGGNSNETLWGMFANLSNIINNDTIHNMIDNKYDQELNTTSDVSFASAFVDNLVAVDFLDTPLVLFSVVNHYDNIILSYISGDTSDRFRIKANGNMSWGDGTNTFDTFLFRTAPNTLETGNLIVEGRNVSEWLYNQTELTVSSYNATWDNKRFIEDNNVSVIAYIDLNNDSVTSFIYFSNGTMKTYVDAEIAKISPGSSINYTNLTFYTYNSTWDNRQLIIDLNTTIMDYIDTNNDSVTSLIYIANTTMKTYVDNAGFLTSVEANSTQIAYQNITNIPVCSGTDRLTYDGTTLSCAAGGTGTFDPTPYYNKTDYDTDDIGWVAIEKTVSGKETILTRYI